MDTLTSRHWRWGWTALAGFVAAGLVLEALHGLKSGAYLDTEHAIRRELWTLAHAHGVGIALVGLVFAAYLSARGDWAGAPLVSRLLLVAQVLVPLGFFLGGLTPSAVDPGVGVWLVPPGGLALFAAVALTAHDAMRRPR